MTATIAPSDRSAGGGCGQATPVSRPASGAGVRCLVSGRTALLHPPQRKAGAQRCQAQEYVVATGPVQQFNRSTVDAVLIPWLLPKIFRRWGEQLGLVRAWCCGRRRRSMLNVGHGVFHVRQCVADHKQSLSKCFTIPPDPRPKGSGVWSVDIAHKLGAICAFPSDSSYSRSSQNAQNTQFWHFFRLWSRLLGSLLNC